MSTHPHAPDRKNGYAAPQLHTHVVVFNMTQVEDGKVRSVQSLQLYRTQELSTAIYRTQAYLKDSSPRRGEVLTEEEKMKERIEREGKTVSENARLKQVAARINRRSKKFDHDKMEQRFPRNGSQARQSGASFSGPGAGKITVPFAKKGD